MPAITTSVGPPFFVAEVTVFTGGGAAPSQLFFGYNDYGWNMMTLSTFAIETTGTIYASDLGYRTLPTDPQGVVSYPPVMSQAFQMDRVVPVEPGQTAASYAWGSIVLMNDDGRFNGIVASGNSDGRPAKILRGTKTWDDTRGIWLDPAYATLQPMFIGVATPWFLGADTLTIPLRDATYWIERNLQTQLYGGTGTYDGTVAMAGQPKPIARGGTTGSPIRNVTPILIDPAQLIYQYNNAPGTVVNLYEGAFAGHGYDGDTSNLYTGSTATGHYRTDNSRGLFQLGSSPVQAITVDVTGSFQVAGAISRIALIAQYLLTEDLALPPGNIDTASFAAADTACPFVGGIYFDPGTIVNGATAVSDVLTSFGAKLIPSRTGLLRCFVLRAV
jgi:hypothetical protein